MQAILPLSSRSPLLIQPQPCCEDVCHPAEVLQPLTNQAPRTQGILSCDLIQDLNSRPQFPQESTGLKPSLSRLCQLIFTSNVIKLTLGTGSVAKTMDWLPRDLKVKPKSTNSFRLNFSPSCLGETTHWEAQSHLKIFSVWGRIQWSSIQLSLEIHQTHSKERQTGAGAEGLTPMLIQVLCTHVLSRRGGKRKKILVKKCT